MNLPSSQHANPFPDALQKDSSDECPLVPLGRTKALICPKCDKLFLSFHGYDLHMEQHPNMAVRCWDCGIRFPSNKSLIQHQR